MKCDWSSAKPIYWSHLHAIHTGKNCFQSLLLQSIRNKYMTLMWEAADPTTDFTSNKFPREIPVIFK